MDNYVYTRPRYDRRNIPARKKKRKDKEGGRFLETFLMQIVVAVLILISVVVLKNVSSPSAKNVETKVKQIFYYNIQISDIYQGIDRMFNEMKTIQKGTEESKVKPEAENPKSVSFDGTEDSGEGSLTYSDSIEEYNIDPEEIPAGTANKGGAGANSPNFMYVSNSSFIAPVYGVITSPYGRRIHPIKKTVSLHTGVDIKANEGVSIKAALGGEVIEACFESTYGNHVKISHPGGFVTLYAHCSKLLVKKGDKVKQGDIIAKVGATGVADGPHLHFEISKDGKHQDPLNYIKLPEN